uniref:phage tail assembly chaperone n=1 Tax=Stappia sp. TaxID=1870903 RepID=UPI003BAC5764
MTRSADANVNRLERALSDAIAAAKPVVPEAGVLLWNLFMELSAGRTYNAAGPNPIAYAEIEAFARLHRWPLQPHHVAIIRAMDDAWLARAYRKMQGSEKNADAFDGRQTAKAPLLTASGFDAVFG